MEEKLSVSIPSVNLSEVKEHLESEVKHLKRQLKWYTENQQLIDNNTEALQKKDKEIALLKEKLSKKVYVFPMHLCVPLTYVDLNPYTCTCILPWLHIKIR